MKSRNNVITTILLALGVFALSPIAQAVNPAPDGGYPGGNTAEGQAALLSLTTGGFNTAVGYVSLRSDASGSYNTAVGAGALLANTGDQNTATGTGALLSNTTGDNNTANGVLALFFNTAGTNNTAIGAGALINNTTGNNNTANGVSALVSNMMGNFNTADGFGALLNNVTGNGNTAIGRGTLSANTGDGNTALGANAGNALTTGVNNIDIGLDVIGVAGESDTIRIGNTNIIGTFIRGISGNIAAGGAMVYVESDGHLGTMTSSARFKDEIKPMGNVSEAILALRPVSFRYKKEIDPHGIPEFGLIAEEVEKVNPDLIIRDPKGRPQTVRYDQINAMLLNEFLKEHRRVEELEKEMAVLRAHLTEQDLKIQKVSAQVEAGKSVPQVVANEP